MRFLACLFGAHRYVRTAWFRFNDGPHAGHELTRRDCIDCGYCPTFER
jgi:hypothetical protein